MKIVANTSDEPTDSSSAVVSNTTLGLLARLTSDLDVRTGEIANPLHGHLGALAELTFPQVTATSAGPLLLLKTTNETKIDRQTMVKPCDTLTRTSVELLAGRLDFPSRCVLAWLELTSSVMRLRRKIAAKANDVRKRAA